MKHAGAAALAQLAGLLAQVRELPGLVERGPGIFYCNGAAFLHFHEDKAGLFADVKIAGAWERFPVNNKGEISAFMKRAKAAGSG